MRNLWLAVRLLFVVYWAYTGWRGMTPGSTPSAFPMGFTHLAWALAVGAIGTRFWIVRPYLNPARIEPWLIPSWYESPIQPSQPFQFFHLCGVSFVAMALSALLRGPNSSVQAASSNLPLELFAGAFGVGVLIGIYWTLHAYPRQFVRRAASDA